MKIRICTGLLADEVEHALPKDDLPHFNKVRQRPENFALIIQMGDILAGVGIFGLGDDGELVLYYARALLPGIGPMALKSLLGTAEVLNTPFRVHADDVEAMRRLAGAAEVTFGTDTDGVKQAIFGA